MKKLTKILSSASLAVGMFLVNPGIALAGLTPMPTSFDLEPGTNFAKLKEITIVSLIQGSIKLILVVAALIFFFILVVGGIQWIVSGGDKAGTEGARKRITNALVGLAIVFVAWAIINLIKVLFGVDIFSLVIPSFQPQIQTQTP